MMRVMAEVALPGLGGEPHRMGRSGCSPVGLREVMAIATERCRLLRQRSRAGMAAEAIADIAPGMAQLGLELRLWL